MRTIGISHRRKATREEPAQPTSVAIRCEDGSGLTYYLATATDEKDFVCGNFPCEWRTVDPTEEIVWFDEKKAPEGFHPHQCQWRKLKADEDIATIPPTHARTVLNAKEYPSDRR